MPKLWDRNSFFLYFSKCVWCSSQMAYRGELTCYNIKTQSILKAVLKLHSMLYQWQEVLGTAIWFSAGGSLCKGGCLYNSQFNIYSQKAHVPDPANAHVAKVLYLCHHLEKKISKHSIDVDKSSEKILEGFIGELKLTSTLCKCLLKSYVHCLCLKLHGSG